MKIYTKEIKNCGACPNYGNRWVGKYPQQNMQRYCKTTRKKLGKGIPDWCPLPDKEETE